MFKIRILAHYFGYSLTSVRVCVSTFAERHNGMPHTLMRSSFMAERWFRATGESVAGANVSCCFGSIAPPVYLSIERIDSALGIIAA